MVAVGLAVGEDSADGFGQALDVGAPTAIAVVVGDLVAELLGHDLEHVVAVGDLDLDRLT